MMSCRKIEERQRSGGSKGLESRGDPHIEVTVQPRALDALALAVSDFGKSGGLSARECQILLLAAQGLTDKEVAGRLCIAYTTVKSYWFRVCVKLSAPHRELLISKLIVSLASNTQQR